MDAATLAFCREQAEEELNSLAHVFALTKTADRTGANKSVYTADSARTYPCSVQEAGALPRENAIGAGDQLTAKFRWLIFMPWGSVVRVNERVAVDGITYEVTDTNTTETEAFLFTAFCVRVT